MLATRSEKPKLPESFDVNSKKLSFTLHATKYMRKTPSFSTEFFFWGQL